MIRLLLLLSVFTATNSFFRHPHYIRSRILIQPDLEIKQLNSNNASVQQNAIMGKRPLQNHKYPISRQYHKQYIRRLHQHNSSSGENEYTIEEQEESDEYEEEFEEALFTAVQDELAALYSAGNPRTRNGTHMGGIRLIINEAGELSFEANDDDDEEEGQSNLSALFGQKSYGNRYGGNGRGGKTSENFEVIIRSELNFTDIGGYDNIKSELNQCIDILSNYTKYMPYNVRVPKGLIFEGPPGNGKTMLAKALAGEAKTGFIAVSGSEFQEKYVGVGASRIRELFKLAKENVPCIIFIDEIDALGRKRSSDGEPSSNERDSTLNELLVALDGFKNTTGIFVIGATNRADLLDSALIRPGRIDKRIYISNPDAKTRRAILQIHSTGKPYDHTVIMDNIVDLTDGLSGAQIENLLNEAMLNALRNDRTQFTSLDIDHIINKMLAGWQPGEHEFTSAMIDQIAIHELGHAVVGLLSKHHSNMTKVVINLSSPNSPAYTIFENTGSGLTTREALFEHLMILLAGRIAEEVFYGVSVTTGAINDFEEALKLANKMVCYYGMGKQLIYPSNSEKYKEMVDNEVVSLIQQAYVYSDYIIRNSKGWIQAGADVLRRDNVLLASTLLAMRKPDEHVV